MFFPAIKAFKQFLHSHLVALISNWILCWKKQKENWTKLSKILFKIKFLIHDMDAKLANALFIIDDIQNIVDPIDRTFS